MGLFYIELALQNLLFFGKEGKAHSHVTLTNLPALQEENGEKWF
jgi:hypothetical protein